MGYCLVTYVELIYELSVTLKKNVARVCVAFLVKYMPIIDNFVSGGDYFELLYNHWIKRIEIFFLLMYGLYTSGKKSFKIKMNMTQNCTPTYNKLRMTGASLLLNSNIRHFISSIITAMLSMFLLICFIHRELDRNNLRRIPSSLSSLVSLQQL